MPAQIPACPTDNPPNIVYHPDTTYNENDSSLVMDIITEDDYSNEPDRTLTYSLSGIDSAKFEIDSVSGVIRFVMSPDFEMPMDADSNNVYVLTITVCDELDQCDMETVAITIQDVDDAMNEPPLVIPNPLVVMKDSIGNICVPIIDPNEGDMFTSMLCGVNNGVATDTIIGNQLCLNYTPDSGFSGLDSICVIVCDQVGACDTTAIPVTVIAPLIPQIQPVPPVVIPQIITVPQDSTGMVLFHHFR